ncbi:MAG: ketol-acid reductoisomerase [Candidatus Marinimicrobia bacterium]|nr:ketol-acid reductoisomerase [Candidatus Neomarinimicrobiota bacterium]
MNVNAYYDSDADLSLLNGKKCAVLGYGSQGHAHSLNLMESGVDVCVGLRKESASWQKAEGAGLKVMTIAEATASADVVMMLLPDQTMKAIYDAEVAPNLSGVTTLAFGHGFNIHYKQIVPPAHVNVIMVAPKSPGHLVRRTYEDGQGVPCLIAVEQDATGNAKDLALAWAKGIGCTRAGALQTNFKDETETDLFGEQAVLCGGVADLVKTGFETLTEAGYPADLAYFECMHELKLIVDLFYEGGLTRMNYSVSETAEYGGMTRGPRVIDAGTKERMKAILKEVQDGSFAQEWLQESNSGGKNFEKLRQQNQEHPIEEVGAKLRGMMSFIGKRG